MCEPDALADAEQAEATAAASRFANIKSLSIVGNRELGAPVDAAQDDACGAGLGVFDDVVQRFLGDPVETERGVGIEDVDVALGGPTDSDIALARHLGAARFQGAGQAGVLEHIGMEVVRQVAHALGKGDGALLD